jgi:hypothetical protein
MAKTLLETKNNNPSPKVFTSSKKSRVMDKSYQLTRVKKKLWDYSPNPTRHPWDLLADSVSRTLAFHNVLFPRLIKPQLVLV